MSDQPNSVRLQDRLMQLANLEANELAEVMQQAAERIEADEALMRQALDALQRLDGWLADRHLGGLMPDEKAIFTALRKRLESSNAS